MMAGLWKQLLELVHGASDRQASSARVRKARAHRKLRLELLENRQLMAADITGVVFQDLTENGLDSGDPRLSGVTIELFRDGGNGTFDDGGGDDISVGSTVSAATTGAYSFSVDTAGTYFVVQTSAATGLLQRPSQRVQTVSLSAGDVDGVLAQTLDSFDTTQQVVTANFPGSTPSQASDAASEAIGGERDIFVDATAGNISVSANDVSNPGLLVFDVGALANGTRIVTYDGADGDAQTLDTNGLGGIDLTSGGTANAFRFLIGGEAGTQLTVQVHSGGNSSSRTISIPTTLPAGPGDPTTQVLDIPFADFIVNSGSGADFDSVGAIQLLVTGSDSADAIIDSFSTVGPTVVTRNFANLAPMSLGNQVFADRNNNGLFDTGATPSETGVAGVELHLFRDSNGNGTFEPGVDLEAVDDSNNPLITTTNASGLYSFTGLFPDDYFVVIPASNFSGAAAAVGHVVSSTIPVGQTNNANVGAAIAGGAVVSQLIQLVAGGAPTTDGDSDNNTNNAIDFGLFSEYDLTINKTTSAVEAAAGSTITYSVTLRNDGPGPAEGVTVVDNIPDGLQILSVTSSVGTDAITIPASAQDAIGANPDDITINVGNLVTSASNQRTITIVARVLPDTVGTGTPLSITNTATISGLGTETGELSNSASSTLPVTRNASLSITKTGLPAAVQIGNNITYTITLRNDGPATARNVVISDTLPAGLNLVSVTSTAGTATPTQGVGSDPDSFLVTVPSVDVDSPTVNTDVVVTVIAQVLAGFSGSTITNTVNGDSDDSQPVSDDATNTVQRVIDLVVNKTIATNPPSTTSPATAPPGSTFTYTIIARNDGPNDATTVRVTDNLPDGIRVISATSSDPTDTITIPSSAQDNTPANPDDILVNIGSLAVGAGAQTTITIVGVVLPGTTGNFTNVATITATDTTLNFEDPSTLGNNTSSIAATAPRTVDLTIDKVGPNAAIAGNTITYTMTATNNGPSDAIGVQVADNIPDGIRVISATLNGTSITIPASASDTNPSNPDDLVFLIGNLASGASLNTLQIVAAILPGTAAGSLINSAVISTTDSTTTEINNINNSDSVTTTVTTQNDVAIAKSGPATIPAGTELTYTLNVTNNGPSSATSVLVTDALPTGLTFLSGSSTINGAAAGSVTANNGVATVTIPSLNPSETAVVTIRATVGVNVTGNLSNTATVAAANDSNPNNNTSAAVSTNVTAPPEVSFAGRIYIDATRNNTNDAGDGPIAGVPVTLTGVPLSSSTPVTLTTTTDANGNYAFSNVSPGTYTVRTGRPTDFNFQSANPGTTGGTAGTQEISGITLNTNSTNNNIGFVRVFSKRLFLASSPRP